MKTNASTRSIIKAVETVSNEKFNGNVVFMNKPKDITKYVRRFTLRTKDVNGPGSMVTKAGQRQPKASWEVQLAVMEEILKTNPDPSIYVDTVYGRKFSTGETVPTDINLDKDEVNAELEPVLVEQEEHTSNSESKSLKPKRKYTRRAKTNAKHAKPRVATSGDKKPRIFKSKGKLIKAFKYLLDHPELMEK